MLRPVHRYLLITGLLLAAAPGWAGWAPPGLVSWGDRSYRLAAGEATTFTIDFDQIPVRRWVLLVEGDIAPSHLNVRRMADGRLVFDQRSERRHEVDVPWGQGEQLSVVLTAGRQGGVYRVSVWGPPPDAYLRAYGYEVNRALESMTRGDLRQARHHLLVALREDPDDSIATLLLAGLDAGRGSAVVAPPDPDAGEVSDGPATAARVAGVRERVAALRKAERYYEAVEALQGELGRPQSLSARVELLVDLVNVMLDLGNTAQAEQALMAAVNFGLDDERRLALADLIERHEP